MKKQVAMSKTNGQLVVAVPLYQIDLDLVLTALDGASITLFKSEPTAYAIDCGPGQGVALMNKTFVEKNLEFLGDL